MKHQIRRNCIAASICMAMLAGTVYADEMAQNFELPTATSFYTNNNPLNNPLNNPQSYLLALNEADTGKEPVAMPVTEASKFEPPFFSGSNAHKYLGIGTVILVGLAAVTAPGEGCEENCTGAVPPRQTSGTNHTRFARAAATMAAATVTTGLLYHWDDFHLEDGFTDPDNQHAMLGAAGALLMLYAVNKSLNSAVPTSHGGTAELGGVAMAVAIKMTW